MVSVVENVTGGEQMVCFMTSLASFSPYTLTVSSEPSADNPATGTHIDQRNKINCPK